MERNEDWSSNVSIYEATLRENPRSSRVHFNLAVTYQDLLKNNEGAKRHFGDVIAIYDRKKDSNTILESQFWDEEIQSHFSLGQILLAENKYAEASKHFIVLSGLAPTGSNHDIVGLSLYGLGRCFLFTGNREQAQKAFEQAIGLIPSLAPEIRTLL